MFPFNVLFDRLGVPEPIGASEDTLAAFEAGTGLTLSPESRAYFGTCDGAEVDEYALNLLSLAQAGEFVTMLREASYPQAFGYLPLTDSNDSNPYCVCCAGPLAGYVVLVSHDDSARVAFRSISAFLTAVALLIENPAEGEDWDIEDIVNDFAGPERTVRDIAVGRALILQAHGMSEPDGESREYLERNDALRFGMALLSDAEVAEIVTLMDAARDPYVLRDTEERLQAMAPRVLEAAETLKQFDAKLTTLLDRCALLLKAEGMVATPKREAYPINGSIGYTLSVRDAKHPAFHLDGRALYVRRNAPDFDTWLPDHTKRLFAERSG